MSAFAFAFAYAGAVPVRGPLGERGLVPAGVGALGCLLFVAVSVAPQLAYTIPCTLGLGLAFSMIHDTVQLKATEVAPDACGAAVALYASAWASGQATGVASMGPTVALFGGAPKLAAFGLGLGLRSNLQRFRP